MQLKLYTVDQHNMTGIHVSMYTKFNKKSFKRSLQ